ncbi:MAG TPA: hypothetical protein VNX68_08045 [Nitrosopumilaceae archaeon]|nr:hypothetical protein [Nitrosopumilaceae archaeon]
MKEYPFEYGHIRVRKKYSIPDSVWKICLFGKAMHLRDILKNAEKVSK